jgi:hypothetical protein
VGGRVVGRVDLALELEALGVDRGVGERSHYDPVARWKVDVWRTSDRER